MKKDFALWDEVVEYSSFSHQKFVKIVEVCKPAL
jgi:hypothetical protein